jgi:hypothetical protein
LVLEATVSQAEMPRQQDLAVLNLLTSVPYGEGNSPCFAWTFSRRDVGATPTTSRAGVFLTESWVIGYVSAMNDAVMHKPLRSLPDPPVIYRWIDGYCGAHQNAKVGEATRAFLRTIR